MSRFHSYISSAVKAIGQFNNSQPLAYQLKQFFAKDKRYGSTDRRMIGALCYGYFRLGHALKGELLERRVLTGQFLTQHGPTALLAELSPELNEKTELPLAAKMEFVKISYNDIFPFGAALSSDIDERSFSASFLEQPKVFLRIRPGKKNAVLEKLDNSKVPYQLESEDCISIGNSIKADSILDINKDVVVQDLNSQKVFDHLKQEKPSPGNNAVSIWDCCAASGGKSILIADILGGHIKLTVSDIRENILVNLKARFQQAKLKMNRCFVMDLAQRPAAGFSELFSVIICDVPCTGSGTWSRTPEQLSFFSMDTLTAFSERQKQIVANAIPHLEPGGLFFYITCSVFTNENEGIVTYIQEKFQLQLIRMDLLKGYLQNADTMFVAVFRK